jgi:hypothetical protein
MLWVSLGKENIEYPLLSFAARCTVLSFLSGKVLGGTLRVFCFFVFEPWVPYC